mmetsp:Transcript_16223/g.32673  ORF Transcript_16223/g.32673 Transcript_16223/m.32673 type:complete len:86 (-) Transcript_16223:112-369(-)
MTRQMKLQFQVMATEVRVHLHSFHLEISCWKDTEQNIALGFGGNDEPGRGGANEDSASMDISAITTPYTKVRKEMYRKVEQLILM